MMLVISTQCHENYGAHDWDGQGECPQYWKAKGGSEYKVTGVPLNIDYEVVIDLIRSQIEKSNEYYRETILGWSIESDDYLSAFERSQMQYEGTIQFSEPCIEYASLFDCV